MRSVNAELDESCWSLLGADTLLIDPAEYDYLSPNLVGVLGVCVQICTTSSVRVFANMFLGICAMNGRCRNSQTELYDEPFLCLSTDKGLNQTSRRFDTQHRVKCQFADNKVPCSLTHKTIGVFRILTNGWLNISVSCDHLFALVTRIWLHRYEWRINVDDCNIAVRKAYIILKACARCARYGEESGQLAFLMGRQFLNITSGNSISSDSWTGLNRLFHEQNAYNVWRDVDPRSPSFIRKSNEIQWGLAEPTNDPAIIYDKTAKRMRDTSLDCTWTKARVYCEHGGPLSDIRNLYQFRTGFPAPISKLVETRTGYVGCYKELSAFTQIGCARKCALNPHCRSVYFHKQDERCILMLYTDALLPARLAKNDAGWTRFGKIGYEGN
ncbi:hypothetical protein CLF_104520 [Clonorchis sinensis]|uniref:Apple domain-containing protein n=1 Tax=Clonorchis sinensis TaxID=79923 RepID=G7YBT5_CLOSI|nr:hypothetical protein CLF_104520 [Clonorchis sinensis]